MNLFMVTLTAIGVRLLSPWAFAQKDVCSQTKKDEYTSIQSVAKNLNGWLKIKSVSEQLDKLDRVTADERLALGANIPLGVGAKRAEFLAFSISSKYCSDTSTLDGMQDALRHFVLSATMAAHAGPQAAMELLNAHEKGGRWDDYKNYRSTIMDIRNNSEGVAFGAKYYAKKNFTTDFQIPEEDFAKEFWRLVEQDKIVVLVGPRDCAVLTNKVGGK